MHTTIYHNPRCRKSREALQLLEEKDIEINVKKYVSEGLSIEELKNILDLLQIQAIKLVRKNEQIWKDQFKGKELTNDEVIYAIHNNPILMERPVVIYKDKAVIARPSEAIQQLFQN